MSSRRPQEPADENPLRRLVEEFVAGLPARLEEIAEAQGRYAQGGDPAALETLHRLVHRLSGAGATFGFPSISAAALALEQRLKRELAVGVESSGPYEEIEVGVAALRRRCLEAGERPAPAPSLAFPRRDRATIEHKRLALVEDDEPLAEFLASQLGEHGYDVTCVASLAKLEEELARIRPAVVLMDIMFAEGPLAGAKRIGEIFGGENGSTPIVFISSRPDLEARVAAVRAGGCAYFTKPIDVEGLVAHLGALTGTEPPTPYRVLIVDDDEQLARLYAEALRAAGLHAEVCVDPLEVMGALNRVAPDLVMLDFHMPGANGPELASALRQMDGFAGLPILFLSTESDRATQLLAVRAGGDEFLTKPIEPEHLVLAVTTRAERGRALQDLLEQDGLTRLLNRASLMRSLEIEMARARRSREPLAFAMVDIDEFKTINDRFGHLVGDRVLRNLAHLLTQRLRKTDLIGRYGGDEIGIVMPTTSAAVARLVLAEVREQFAELDQLPVGGGGATFSAGVATFPESTLPEDLTEAADRALYRAKRAGRNRIYLDVD